MTSSSPGEPPDRWAGPLVVIERYLLSAAYLYLAGRILYTDYHFGLGWISSGGSLQPSLPEAASDLLLFLMQFSVAVVLLASKRPATHHATLKEILVPLAAASFFLVYNTITWFPIGMQRNLYPTPWPDSLWSLHPIDAAAMLCGLIGPAIALWGVLTLRRSFGIFVSVREVVLRGPYRYVRHPIYLGYTFIYGGLVLFERSWAVLLIASTHIALFAWRARLEEARLAAFSPAYRERMKQSGFFFPRFRRPA